MKTFILIIAALSASTYLKNNDKLVGRWESPVSPKGNITGVVFRNDSTYDSYINKKPFTSGVYRIHDGTITIRENGCGDREGTYQLIFYSNNDSLRFQSIADSCTERMNGMNRLRLGKIK